MQCEICAKIIEKGKRIRLEGSVVTACDDCSSYGTIVEDLSSKKGGVVSKNVGVVLKRKKETLKDYEIEFDEELVVNYAEAIKNARERAGLKQDELAKMINEQASLIHRIESKRVEPPLDVAKKIQNKLKIKLLKKVESVGDVDISAKKKGELTLGDLVVVRGKKK